MHIICFDYVHHLILPLVLPRSISLLSTAPNLAPYFLNNPPSPICLVCIFMGVGHPQEFGPHTTPLKKSHSSSLQIYWFINSSSVTGANSWSQELMRLSLLHAELLSGLILYRPCKSNHSCYNSMSTAVLSYPEDTILLWSAMLSGSYNISTSSSKIYF